MTRTWQRDGRRACSRARRPERAEAFHTLIEPTELEGVDPDAGLREACTRIADHPRSR